MFALIPMSIINEKEKKDDDLEEAWGVLKRIFRFGIGWIALRFDITPD